MVKKLYEMCIFGEHTGGRSWLLKSGEVVTFIHNKNIDINVHNFTENYDIKYIVLNNEISQDSTYEVKEVPSPLKYAKYDHIVYKKAFVIKFKKLNICMLEDKTQEAIQYDIQYYDEDNKDAILEVSKLSIVLEEKKYIEGK